MSSEENSTKFGPLTEKAKTSPEVEVSEDSPEVSSAKETGDPHNEYQSLGTPRNVSDKSENQPASTNDSFTDATITTRRQSTTEHPFKYRPRSERVSFSLVTSPESYKPESSDKTLPLKSPYPYILRKQMQDNKDAETSPQEKLLNEDLDKIPRETEEEAVSRIKIMVREARARKERTEQRLREVQDGIVGRRRGVLGDVKSQDSDAESKVEKVEAEIMDLLGVKIKSIKDDAQKEWQRSLRRFGLHDTPAPGLAEGTSWVEERLPRVLKPLKYVYDLFVLLVGFSYKILITIMGIAQTLLHNGLNAARLIQNFAYKLGKTIWSLVPAVRWAILTLFVFGIATIFFLASLAAAWSRIDKSTPFPDCNPNHVLNFGAYHQPFSAFGISFEPLSFVTTIVTLLYCPRAVVYGHYVRTNTANLARVVTLDEQISSSLLGPSSVETLMKDAMKGIEALTKRSTRYRNSEKGKRLVSVDAVIDELEEFQSTLEDLLKLKAEALQTLGPQIVGLNQNLKYIDIVEQGDWNEKAFRHRSLTAPLQQHLETSLAFSIDFTDYAEQALVHITRLGHFIDLHRVWWYVPGTDRDLFGSITSGRDAEIPEFTRAMRSWYHYKFEAELFYLRQNLEFVVRELKIVTAQEYVVPSTYFVIDLGMQSWRLEIIERGMEDERRNLQDNLKKLERSKHEGRVDIWW